MNHAKSRLAAGELVICMSIRQARSLDVVMLAAAAGFDCVYVDLEHSPLSLETASLLCVGAPALGVTPLVRVPSHAPDAISRALDGGAQGVIVPHVNDAAQARAAVAAARFPPVGRRSVGGPSPALGYRALPLAEINDTLNRETLMVAMIETPAAVERADEIAAVEGIDMLLIGSNDLCTEMGIPGQLRDPRLMQAYERVAAACTVHGRHLGVGGVRGDAELQRRLLALGARFIIGGSDMTYLATALNADAKTLRSLAP